ncbi:MATE family efflux transporter [Polynucleobacter sp. JS-JIR-II-b4]|uniref:MATE family efflux transporter n=1 Tax=Polynucleobacter sp. JS-JIR-II-b4 TaxID=1758390 RepID=UPI001BFEC4F0|nr:MATE family efflux transporter [Polynucleobacter sp. JS-JIR-II-b4]QWE02842.1 hypothetical protein ICV90_01760 [Polynucleobacter sp. JS-JIR-II-b4]
MARVAAISNLFYKISLMVVMIFSVRMTLLYLGVERYGIWLTISSLVGILNIFDLGVGNALINRVASASSRVNNKKLCNIISGGLFTLGLISFAVGILFYLVVAFVPWHSLLKIDNQLIYLETYATIKTFVLMFALTMFTEGVNKVFYGMQRIYEANIMRIIGAFLTLPFIWFAIKLNAGMPYLLVASMSGAIVANLVLMGLLFLRKQFSLENLFLNSRIEMPHLFKMGGLFFFLQMGSIVVYGADNLIIANFLGATSVAIYGVVQKMFQFTSQSCLVVNSGLWPAYANAKEHGDSIFIRHTLIKSILLTLAIAVSMGLILIIFGGSIISHWTNHEIIVSVALLSAFCFWSIADAVANSFAMFLNGLSLLKPQMMALFTLIFFGMPLKIWLASQFGLVAMLTGFTIFFLANILFWYCLVNKEIIFSTLYEKKFI